MRNIKIMKNIHIIWIVLSLMMIGCKKNVSLENGDVIMIDVAKDGYSQKEIILQDFMDVEYIALDSSDDFLCQGQVLAVGAKIIVVRNDIQDGDIYLFDRKKGTGIRKINRKGNGNEEYTIAYNVVLDEDNEELFVNDVMQNKIIVYDLSGNYKRHFSRYEKARINQIYNFDKEKLICKIEDDNVTLGKSTFIVISKQTGEVVIETSISYKEKKMMKIADGGNLLMFYSYPSILHFQNHWIFSEVSSDTVFKFSPEHDRVPVIIKRPSIQSMLPEVFLFPKISSIFLHPEEPALLSKSHCRLDPKLHKAKTAPCKTFWPSPYPPLLSTHFLTSPSFSSSMSSCFLCLIYSSSPHSNPSCRISQHHHK